jgi:segregation and condensation protein B
MNSRGRKHGVQNRRPTTVRPGNFARQHKPFTPDAVLEESHDSYGRDLRLARVEAALMFADEPLPSRRLAVVAGLADAHEARQLIEKLRQWYDADASAFQIQELAGGYQLLTRDVYHPWLLRLRRTGHDVRLTPAALETLAVVAYKQPITRADVEAIRGVAVTEMIRLLMEKGLVRVGARHDSLGRPQLYVTTKRFLQVFGLNSLDQLPEVTSLNRPKS